MFVHSADEIIRNSNIKDFVCFVCEDIDIILLHSYSIHWTIDADEILK
jgi:hypothetical protein